MPEISVIVTAYGCEPYIADTLKSLQQQTFNDWEAIVIDDGSPDNVAKIITDFADKDNRIKYIHTVNHGVSAARNHAASYASGKYILPLDGDDMIDKTYLEKASAILDENDSVVLVYCKWQFFTEGCSHTSGLITPELHYTYYADQLVHNSIFNCAMIRKTDFDQIGGYDENMTDGCEDWEMWIRLLNPERFPDTLQRVVQIPERLFFYRQKQIRHNPSLQDPRLHKALDYIYQKHIDKYRCVFGHPILMAQTYCAALQNEKRERHDMKIRRRIKRYIKNYICKETIKLPV